MLERILAIIIVVLVTILVLFNPWYDIFDLISIPGWKTITTSEKIDKCVLWEKEVVDDLGLNEMPEIIIGENTDKKRILYGEYRQWNNTIVLYLDNLDNLVEAYDTVCHELRHAYQKQEIDGKTELGQEFLDSFENYIPYAESHRGYEKQLVEKDARGYARKMVINNFFRLVF